eukprot:TRINITY_DN357_c2_g1_i2.p3 TRINITY_DN357_c2_g1~~TRINITY_DN357_c2_g1_i2.p3  ORF type:complete len:488 (-),score=273.83 TRINITY_DN357_c2_g1_i2:46-1509(-)
MFFRISVLFGALAALAATVSGEAVVTLTESTFDSFIAAEEFTVVEFYAPWCGHCKRLEQPYEAAAQALAKDTPPVRIAKVDATEQKALADRFDVRGYPTLKIFRGGRASDYDGPRDEAGIVAYVRKQAGPAATELADGAGALAALVASLEVPVIVGRFGGSTASTPSAAAREFLRVAGALRNDFRFAIVHGDASAGSEGVVELHRASRFVNAKHDEAVLTYDAANRGDAQALKAWVDAEALPLVSQRTRDTARLFEATGLPIVTLYGKIDYTLDPKGSNYLANRLRRVAKAHRGELVFGLASAADYAHELSELGLTGRAVGVAGRGTKGEKYVMDAEWSVDAAAAFAAKLARGEVEQFLKSEPEPADNSGPVTVLTGRSFDKIVDDESKDVLVEFYAPWCGHCKTLAPKWDKVGEHFKDDADIVIAKIDATANDYASRFAVRGYPTIYWVPKNNKQSPSKYEGGREVDDIVKWIDENRSDKGGREDL